MEGFHITLYTQQDRYHGADLLTDWLMQKARELGFSGATLVAGIEGFGHDGMSHKLNMFDYSGQPVQIKLILTEAETQVLFDCLNKENLRLFYTKTPVEFGVLGRQTD